MESEQVQMYQISKGEQSNTTQNVVLRSLVGNPNRHQPQAQHPLPVATTTTQEVMPASMYTLDTRYQPIPEKVLPRSSVTKLYIDTNKSEQTSAPITEEDQDTPQPIKSQAPIFVNEGQENQPIIFLEPKIISQPILYSIVGAKTLPIQNNQIIPVKKEMPSPILYTITGQPHRLTIDTNKTTANVPTPFINKSPILYSLVSNPRLQVSIQEPIKKVPKTSEQQPSSSLYSVIGNPHLHPQIELPVKQVSTQPQQKPSPTLYSIIGSPKVTPIPTQEKTFNAPPSTRPVKDSSIQPAPILYTIVGEIQVPNDLPKENRSPLPPVKKPPNDAAMNRMNGDPRKTQPLQPRKQIQPPTLSPLRARPYSPPEENTDNQLKPPVRRRTPPPHITPTRRISRSLDRQPAPKRVTEDDTSMPPIKNKRPARSKESTIPKSATVFIPLTEHERTPRSSKQHRTTPWRTSPGLVRHKPLQIAHHDPLRLPDYISPYAYHPLKPYREETYNPISFPILTNPRPRRAPRPEYNQPRRQFGHHYPYDPWSNHSLERYPVHSKQNSRSWDFENDTQSDVDNADDYDSPRKKQGRRRFRPRTPWVPVW